VSRDAPAEVTLRLEMACTEADFHRLLPAVAEVQYDAVLNRFSHLEKGRRWSLRLNEPHERRIGALRLPVADVTFLFEGYAQNEIDAIMERFLTHFRRGGG
jgi:hypothetical protein